MINSPTNICGIIVTFNRLDELLNCLSEIENGTKVPDHLVIFDNGSIDGTTERLIKAYALTEGGVVNFASLSVRLYKRKNMSLLRSEENWGGAGGFSVGLTYACENFVDASGFWLMDDDGRVAQDALERLCKHELSNRILNSLVLNIDNQEKLSFGLTSGRTVLRTKKDIHKAQRNGLIPGTANPFNGTLIGRDVVEKIGAPMAQLFIWGDEEEYVLRAKEHGIEVATVVDAIHLHPAGRKEVLVSKYFGVMVNRHQSTLKNYCDYRNRAYLLWNFRKVGFVSHVARHCIFNLERFDLRSLMFFINASLDGVLKRWGKERKFLS